ncbi:MAG TPA: hypothetical protein VKG45_10670 [Actinomycetes bacterium]|nr:hypothetical protein [Actinomycetes bacterium]
MAEQPVEIPGSDDTGGHLDAVRGQRLSLRRALAELEDTLASPAAGRERTWSARLLDAVRHLSEVFDLHVAVTEGPDGLHEDILDTAPRLANGVRRLKAEHAQIRMALNAELLRLGAAAEGGSPEVEQERGRLTLLLGRLVRHRQRGAELIYEAYAVDIGGES